MPPFSYTSGIIWLAWKINENKKLIYSNSLNVLIEDARRRSNLSSNDTFSFDGIKLSEERWTSSSVKSQKNWSKELGCTDKTVNMQSFID